MSSVLALLTILLQLAAACAALRLVRTTRKQWGWLTLSVALLLMVVYRLMNARKMFVSGGAFTLADGVGLLISLLLFVSILGVGSILGRGALASRELEIAKETARLDRELAEVSQRETQEALAREEAQKRAAEVGRLLEVMVDSAEVWISRLDREGRVVLWNQGAEAISGYAREEVLGKSDFWEKLYPDAGLRKELVSGIQDLGRGQGIHGVESILMRKDGASRTMTWFVSPILSDSGSFEGTLAVGLDHTELHGTREELAKVTAFQDLILDKSALGLALGKDRTLQWINPRGAEILGLSPAEVIGKSGRFCFPDESAYESFMSVAYAALAKSEYWDCRVQLRKRNGSLFWCRLVGRALNRACPEQGVVWLLEDITIKLEIERALADSEERFRGAFEASGDALVMLTPKGIFDANRQAVRLFGYAEKSELLQKSLLDLMPSGKREGGKLAEELKRYVQSAMAGEVARFRWLFRDACGWEFNADVSLSSLPMGKRKVLMARLAAVVRVGTQAEDNGLALNLLDYLDQSPIPTMINDAQVHRLIYFNKAALAILRCSLDELQACGPGDLSPPFQPDGRPSEACSREMDAIALVGGTHRFYWTHRSPHRGSFPVEVTLNALQPGFSRLLVVQWQELSV